MDERIQKVLTNLEKNNIKTYYAENKEKVCETVRSLLFDGCSITAGGSVSLKESGVWEIMNDVKYNFYDRSKPGISKEEQLEAFRAAIGCDFFFCSSNAVTENGELVNVDGNSNRISSICFGPQNVIMVVGKNKIVKDVDEGILRVKKVAAPLNTVRLKINAPCAKLGHCVSLEKSTSPSMTDGCHTDCRICDNYLISARQRFKNRIKLILCEEKLGY